GCRAAFGRAPRAPPTTTQRFVVAARAALAAPNLRARGKFPAGWERRRRRPHQLAGDERRRRPSRLCRSAGAPCLLGRTERAKRASERRRWVAGFTSTAASGV